MDARTFTTYPFWKHTAKKGYIVWLYPRTAEAHLTPWLLDTSPELAVVFNHLTICPTEGSMTTDDHGRPLLARRTFSSDMPETPHNTLGLAQHPNVCVKLSGQYAFSEEPYPYLDLRRWHGELMQEMGADRCMWATDFPWLQEDPGYGKLTRVLDKLLPSPEDADRTLIMSETARRMVWRESASSADG